ncbi:MAG: sigma-E factor negative regulatory protein [Acidiferrobacterales bacterium]|jgi:sigma-E factor negative regulatory protein RseA|nr:sigma-E factor negative regulatory protein [Acidiferrobacterales bacterium]
MMNEKLSALMDGELEPDQLQKVLKDAGSQDQLKKTWSRFYLAREVMRQELDHLAAADLADNVAAQLLQEPTILAPRRVLAASRIKRVATGMALAASVAAVALVGVRWMAPDDVAAPQYIASVENADYLHTGATRWQSVPNDVEENLNAYLVEHSEFSSTTSMNGVMSYVRFAGYDSEK